MTLRTMHVQCITLAIAAACAAMPLPALADPAAPDAGEVPAGIANAAANELARKVANPVASLVSVPIQWNFDDGIGPFDAERTTVNLQPVVPISLGPSAKIRLISRTVLPFLAVDGGPLGPDVSGVGDLTQSLFVANARPIARGWTIGIGPVLQFPTGSDARLSSERWSAGPTAIAVCQRGQWTCGALVNHLWSYAGDAGRADVSTTFLQPFVNFIEPTHTTLALNVEASRDWTGGTWSVPLNLMINQIVKVGPMPMSVFVGTRAWLESPAQGPEGAGWRAGTTLLFPTSRPRPAGGRP